MAKWIVLILFVFSALIIGAGMMLYMRIDQASPNIVLISIDTCRADYLGCYGSASDTTPNIDRFAANAVRFENVITPVPLTLPSHCTVMTGKSPMQHGVHNNINYSLPPKEKTLAEFLKDKGYITGAAVSTFVLDKKFGLAQGFDMYDDDFSSAQNQGEYPERKGEQTARIALDWLDRITSGGSTRPFFLFTHFYDPHHPYSADKDFADKFPHDPYAAEVAYTDHCIGQIIEKLKSLDVYKNSIVIIFADHGEGLGDHNELYHGFFVYQSTVKVPMIIKPAGKYQPGTVKKLVSIADITPTISAMLKTEPPKDTYGRDLSWAFQPQRPTASNERKLYCETIMPTEYDCSPIMALVTGKYKYIRTPRQELYDLQSDPGEENNLYDQQPHRAKLLQGMLDEIVISANDPPGAEMTLSDADMQKLRSLGYVASAADSNEFTFDLTRNDPKDWIDFHQQVLAVRACITQAQYDQARKICRLMIDSKPQVAMNYYYLGKALFGDGDKIGAAINFNKFLETVESDPAQPLTSNPHIKRNASAAYHLLGMIYADRNKLDQAGDYFQRSLDLKDDSFETHYNLARVYYMSGRLKKAITEFKKAMQLESDSADVLLGIADVYASKGEYDNALEYYKRGQNLEPDLEIWQRKIDMAKRNMIQLTP